MKTDKELLKIWEESRERNNYKAIKEYDDLSLMEKTRIFDIGLEGGLEKND